MQALHTLTAQGEAEVSEASLSSPSLLLDCLDDGIHVYLFIKELLLSDILEFNLDWIKTDVVPVGTLLCSAAI